VFLTAGDTRAMWLWNESPSTEQLLNNTGGARDDLMAFMSAPHGQSSRALNRIFFEARAHATVDTKSQLRPVTYDPLLDAGEQPKLRAFIKEAKSHGVGVEYLDAQGIWLATDTNAEVPKQICRDVVTFNKTTSDVDERLDGVHLDIEPHTVTSGPWAGEWWENRLPNGYNADWTARWQAIFTSCRATFDAYEAQTGHRLVLSSDVGTGMAYWNKPMLNFFNGPNTPIEYITIMNYYDNRPNQNGDPSFFYGDDDGWAHVGGVIQNLNLWTNIPVLFGVETGPTQIAPDWMSFYQEGYNAMYVVIDELFANYSSLGVAIHHYAPHAYKDLQP
jgi:hypothetical protein